LKETLRCSNCNKPVSEGAYYCTTCSRLIGAGHFAVSQPRRALSITIPLLDDELDIEEDQPLQPETWHKEVAQTTTREHATYPPRPTHSHPAVFLGGSAGNNVAPTLVVWACLFVIVFTVLGGVLGVFMALGHGPQVIAKDAGMMLQVSPSTVAIGTTMTLRGSHFSHSGRVQLTRGLFIPVVDTAGSAEIDVDADGQFTDTVVVTKDWGVGQHMLQAQDVQTHKVASFPIKVIGENTSLRPAHLKLSQDTLDFGTGDLATNSTQLVTLSNTGEGQISWQASSDQPWLQTSPGSGMFIGEQSSQVMIAAVRANLQPGSYSGHVTFSSNAGNSMLTVTLKVIPLKPGNEAVMQISSPTLSFNAIDADTFTPAQGITVSNPGVLQLEWQASSDVKWLSISPSSGTVLSGDGETLSVAVDPRTLLPGTYHAIITLSSDQGDGVKDSPQSVYVSVTIAPSCALLASPNTLAFSGIAQQSAPAMQTIDLGVSHGCKSSIAWSAATNVSWLSVNLKNGQTPATLTVSANLNGLMPGTYDGAVVISSVAGAQTIPVTLTLGKQTMPLLAVSSPSSLAFTGVAGQPNPAVQALTFANTGSGTLFWDASVSTTGGNWLALSQQAGTLSAQQGATLGVSAALLPSLAAGTYNGIITLTGRDSTGQTVAGSPRTIAVSFVVGGPCTFSATPTNNQLSFAGNTTSQTFTVKTSGNCAGNIVITPTIKLDQGSDWLTVSPNPATTPINSQVTFTVNLLSVKLPAGAGPYTASIMLDVANGSVKGTPQQVAVSVSPAVSGIQVNPSSTMNFSTLQGVNPGPQSLVINNTGAGTLSWTLSGGSVQSWVTATPTQGGNGARITFSVNVAGLSAGNYQAQFLVTPTSGQPVPITVNLSVAGTSVVTPTPIPTATPTPQSQGPPTPTATPVSTPKVEPTPTAVSPTATPVSTPEVKPTPTAVSPTATPVSTPKAEPTPTAVSPTATPVSTPKAEPTPTAVSPTATPVSTPKAKPTPTAVSPTATVVSTPKAEATPKKAPTATPVSTPQPRPTPTPVRASTPTSKPTPKPTEGSQRGRG